MSKMSRWAKIETSREIRQWIGLAAKAIGGVAVGCAWIESHPETKMKLEAYKYELKKKFKKKN